LGLHEAAPSLSVACLHTVARYVPWIAIDLVTTPAWLDATQRFLRVASLHDGACVLLTEMYLRGAEEHWVPHLRVRQGGCLRVSPLVGGSVVKRMEPQAKMAHLQALQLVRVLSEAVANGVVVTTRLARLVAALTTEVLDCWDRLHAAAPMLVSQAIEMLAQVFPLLLTCFASEEKDTSQATFDCCETHGSHSPDSGPSLFVPSTSAPLSAGAVSSYLGRLRKLLLSPEDTVSQETHVCIRAHTPMGPRSHAPPSPMCAAALDPHNRHCHTPLV
jgi:hypothetical protein